MYFIQGATVWLAPVPFGSHSKLKMRQIAQVRFQINERCWFKFDNRVQEGVPNLILTQCDLLGPNFVVEQELGYRQTSNFKDLTGQVVKIGALSRLIRTFYILFR